MDLIEKIGPFVGLAAFVGLAVLAFLLFQQSRDLRRLREWAGRAPERAKEAADASLAAAEIRGEETEEEKGPGPLSRAWASVKGFVGPRYEAFDRRLPIDGRILLGVLGAGIIAAAVLTSGFGLVGDDGRGGGKAAKREQKEQKPKVAVLNATQTVQDGVEVQGISGLADKVASEVVKQEGYPTGTKTNAPTGFAETVIMYKPDFEGDAAELARSVQGKLGETGTQEMTDEIQSASNGAPLVLVVGADDASF
jgi:hypothetical protein